MGVSKNSGTPKSSILIGFSIINHPFWGTPIFGDTDISIFISMFPSSQAAKVFRATKLPTSSAAGDSFVPPLSTTEKSRILHRGNWKSYFTYIMPVSEL